MRRVGTIALVHETLSQGFDETVDFDEIAVRGLRARRRGGDPASTGCEPVCTGTLRADARRGRHRARDDHHRARAERRRARVSADAGGTVARRPSTGRPASAATGRSDRDDHRRRGRARPGPAGPWLGARARRSSQSLVQRPAGAGSAWEPAQPRGTRVALRGEPAAARVGAPAPPGEGRGRVRSGRREGPVTRSAPGWQRRLSRRGGRGRCGA